MSCYFLIGSSANLRIVQSLISHLTTLNFRYKNQSISHFTLNSRKVLRFSHVFVTSQNMLWHLSASKQLDLTPFQVCIPQLVHKFNSKIRKMKTSQNKCFRSCLNQNKMYYVYRKEAETALGTHELSLNTMKSHLSIASLNFSSHCILIVELSPWIVKMITWIK